MNRKSACLRYYFILQNKKGKSLFFAQLSILIVNNKNALRGAYFLVQTKIGRRGAVFLELFIAK
jgi:hypothetical protein